MRRDHPRFLDPSVSKSLEMDLALIDHYDKLLNQVEFYIAQSVKVHDVDAFYRLRSVPGIGKILAMVILYEIHDTHRFPTVQDFVSYARLVKCPKESAGKRYGFSGTKIGNMHPKWAFSASFRAFSASELLNHAWNGSPRGMESPRRYRSSPTSWDEPSITCSRGKRRLP